MSKKRELERTLEERCVAKVEAAGGMALKLHGQRGFPDRTILLPDAGGCDQHRTLFVEFKRDTVGVISAQQRKWQRDLEALGFKVYVVDSDEQFDEILREWL